MFASRSKLARWRRRHAWRRDSARSADGFALSQAWQVPTCGRQIGEEPQRRRQRGTKAPYRVGESSRAEHSRRPGRCIRFAITAFLNAAALSASSAAAQQPAPSTEAAGKVASTRCGQDNRPYRFTLPIDQDQRGPDPARTDLMRKLSLGDVSAACQLIAAGANINAVDRDGATALLIAVGMGQTGVVRALLAAGADVNAADRAGGMPLCDAAFAGSLAIVEELVEAGANVNRADRLGNTALMCACQHPGVVRFLLGRGAEVDARDALGRTALMKTDRAGTVRLLIRSGADVNAVDRNGDTALSNATHFGRKQVASLLKQAGARR
jgi:hypothetical protein